LLISFERSRSNIMEPVRFNLKGTELTQRQLSEHMKLYEGYCRKIDEIRNKLLLVEREGNSTYSEIRELKLEEGFCLNAIKLHELYFQNISQKSELTNKSVKIISANFGNYENWKKEFLSISISARGWIVLAYDMRDNRLYNYISDMHNQGGIWNTIPIIVLDMYEHSYFIEFGADRKSYVEWFLVHINWKIVENRIDQVLDRQNFCKEVKK
jgi:superoxide dismutase, Fe-Mn family